MRKITLLFILFYTTTNFAQKQIPGIQIQETNLLISAEVDSPSRVTFKITPLGENKAVDTFIVTSFNNITFKAMALKHLTFLNNSESENFKSEIYKYSDQDIDKLNTNSESGQEENINKEKLAKQKDLEKAKDNVDFLFNYFDNQINILYKYDTEPVAGVLHFKKDNIEIQHFEDTAYEIYFNNMKRNYHKLIKELFEKRIELVKDTIKVRSDIKEDLVEYVSKYFKKSKKDYLYELSGLEDSEPTESETTGDSNEQNSSDDADNQALMAEQFLKDFRPLIEDFRSYNRNKRMEIIYKKILSNRNQIILNEISTPIDSAYTLFQEIKYFEGVISLSRKINTLDDSISKIKKEIKIQENSIKNTDSLKAMREKKLEEAKTKLSNFYLKNEFGIDTVLTIDEKIERYEKFKNEKMEEFKSNNKEEIKLRNKYFSSKQDSMSSIAISSDEGEAKIKSIIDSLKAMREKKLEEAKTKLSNFYLKNEFGIDTVLTIDEKIERYEKFKNEKMEEFKSNNKEEIKLRNEYFSSKQDSMSSIEKSSDEGEAKIKSIIDSLNKILINKEVQKSKFEGERDEFPSETMLKYFDLAIKSSETKNNEIKNYLEDLKNRKDYWTETIKNDLKYAPLWYFEPTEIQLDFNDGFVEHVVVEGLIQGLKLSGKQVNKLTELGVFSGNIQLKFTNNYPLGFSSSKDFDDFKEHKVSVYVGKHKRYEMRLGDLFPNYIQTLQNDRLNFSPKDQAVTIYTDQDPTYRELKKESSSKLLQVKVYSDFVGLNSSDPNGTFQLELEKYIPIYTKRKSGLMYERYFGRGSNIGFFNYIKPEFRWSRPGDKDDNDKLELQSINAFNGSESITLPYATHLDLMRFESLSVGADLNLFVFDFPTAKWRMEVNASGRYGVTDVVNSDDTNVDDTNLTVNTWRFYPEFIFRLRPEERYGANLSLRRIRFNSVTDGFSNISSANAFITTLMDDEQWLHQIEINAHFSPKGNKDNRFFFRYRYTNNARWEYNGFSEIQVGYSMSLKF